MNQSSEPKIILASSSKMRQDQLATLGLNFSAIAPDIDETPLPQESAAQLVKRLAQAKARTVQKQHPQAVVIGADQVQTIQGEIFGKPLTHERAYHQLQLSSEQLTTFYAGLTVLYQDHNWTHVIPTNVLFKPLTSSMIRRYVALDQPLQAAGSICVEKRGLWLIQQISSKDPTAIYGLPMLTLINSLSQVPVRWDQ